MHDIPTGSLKACQVCGSTDLDLVLDLGHQPLCDSLLSPDQLDEPEVTYPLRQVRCLDCGLNQIDYVVPGEVVFHPEYPYRSGITRELVEYQDSMSETLVSRYGLEPGSLVLDIGSNDGTLLQSFQRRGMKVLGVEPTNIAEIARENGVDTRQAFFTENLAEEIVEEYGAPSIVTSTNTFAHMTGLGEVLRGVSKLLQPGGVFVTENHNLLDVVTTGQFDTIYHEHLRTYSLKSLIRLYSYYDFTVAHAERVGRYGGNLRCHAVKGKGGPVSDSVAALLAEEEETGLYGDAIYAEFRDRAARAKNDLMELAIRSWERGDSFVGNSCPGRSVTLLNYAGMTSELMPYICEQPTSLKLGQYLPGKHIPVVENSRLIEEQPDYVVLLAWHYADAIMEQLRARGLKSKFVIPLPELSIVED